MVESFPKLEVCVLGGLSVVYGDRPISFGRSTITRALKLLQILLCHGDRGISRKRLLEELYGREELADVSNNLRVTAYRLKKILMEVGLPQHDYIVIKKGNYYWNAPMETELDVDIFTELLEKAKAAKDEDAKIQLLKEACQMYKGDFLPELSGDEWVMIANIKYKEKYTEALKQLSSMLIEKQEYEEALRLIDPACDMYPFDEWQSVKIECYIKLGRYDEAMEEYEKTARMFFEELGVSVSDKMLDQFEIMSSHMNFMPHEMEDIKRHLEEEKEQSGAYYCSLPSFRDSYRLVSRIVERNGQSVYLMQCSITNGKGQPMEKGKKLEVLVEELDNTIHHCLRRGDCYTKYSPSQFLILLAGLNRENCSIIFDRITKYFSREHKSWAQYLEFVVSSVADMDQDKSEIKI